MHRIRASQPVKVVIPGHSSVCIGDVVAIASEARANRIRVIEGAAAIEHELVRIARHYFHPDSREKADEFEAIILDSDWCSFSAKRKIVAHVISKLELLEGKEKNDYDKLLKDVMSFRNAFTHGEMVIEAGIVSLHYFESSPRKAVLSDEYLQRVEKVLMECFRSTRGLAVKIGALSLKEAESGEPGATDNPDDAQRI